MQNGEALPENGNISLFQNEQIMSALYTTLVIALLSALIATLIGTAAAIGIQGMKRKSRTIAMGITNIPMLKCRYRDRYLIDAFIYRCRIRLKISGY